MKRILLLIAIFGLALAAKKQKTAKQTEATSPAPPAPVPDKPPTINWGNCPQLEPKEADRQAKATVLDACLKQHPVPTNLTEESVEKHQRQIAECALKKEKWFDKSGNYKFSKAESEIKKKKLNKDIETKLVGHHSDCSKEAKQQFPKKDKVIEQIQLYQACMDFHITESCAIKVDT